MIVETVLISDILSDDAYNVGRKSSIKDLEASILKYGIIDKPILIKENNGYRIVSGHNRISVCRNHNFKQIEAEIWNVFDHEKFIDKVLLKVYNKQVSAAGRMKAYNIILHAKGNSADSGELKKMLNIPAEIDEAFIAKYFGLPDKITAFVNDKDVPLRVISQLNESEEYFIAYLSAMIFSISSSDLRIIMDMYDDIKRDPVKKCDLKSALTSSGNKNDLMDSVRKIRYEKIEEYCIKANQIKSKYAKKGAQINIPVYGESGNVKVVIEIKKRDNGASYKKALEYLLSENTGEITDLM